MFFKSSINDIILNWWKEKKSRKNNEINILNQLRVNLHRVTIYYISILIDALQLQQNPGIVNNIDYKNRNSETAKTLGILLDDISLSERFYPSIIRDDVKKFISKNSDYLVLIIENKNTISLHKIIKELQDDSDKIIKQIEELIF